MDKDRLKTIFGEKDLTPITLPSGHIAWVLLELDNISIVINDGEKGKRFNDLGHPEEEFIYVLDGYLEYIDGRIAKSGEAVFHIADAPHTGGYSGRLLSIKVLPQIPLPPLDTQIMKTTIIPKEIEPVRGEGFSPDADFKPLAVSRNFSVLLVATNRKNEWIHSRSPGKGIVYCLMGQLEYSDGRTVRENEAICFHPGQSSPDRFISPGPVRFLEIAVPPDPRLLEK